MKFRNACLPSINRDHTICAWFAQNKIGNWIVPTIDMTVWKKDLLKAALRETTYANCEKLRLHLDEWIMKNNVLGLIFSDQWLRNKE